MNRIFYYAKNNEFYFEKIHKVRPLDAVDVTNKYDEYRTLELQGYTRKVGDDGLPVYTAPVQAIDDKKTAKQLLHKTHHFETNSHRNLLFTTKEYEQFEQWRHALLGVVIEDGELPETPKFITNLMEKH